MKGIWPLHFSFCNPLKIKISWTLFKINSSVKPIFAAKFNAGDAMGILFQKGLPVDSFHYLRIPNPTRNCCPHWSIAQRKLDQINQVREVREHEIPPGNKLERPHGDRETFFQDYGIPFCRHTGDLAYSWSCGPTGFPATSHTTDTRGRKSGIQTGAGMFYESIHTPLSVGLNCPRRGLGDGLEWLA